MPRLSRAELALFVFPFALVPAAIYGQRWKAARPRSAPRPVRFVAAKANLYSNFWPQSVTLLPSPDGKWIYTGVAGAATRTRFAKWNARSGELVRPFATSRFGNADAVLSPSGTILGYGEGGSGGNRVVLLDPLSGTQRGQIARPPSVAGDDAGFDLSNELVALATNRGVSLFRADNGRPAGKLAHRVSDYYPKWPRFSADGRQLAWIGSSNRDFASYANGVANDEVVWFDLAHKKRLGVAQFSHCDLFGVRFSGDGRTLLVCGFRRFWASGRGGQNDVCAQAEMWALDARSGQTRWNWNLSGWVKDVSASPDGRFFAFEQNFGSSGDHITVREVKSNREVCRVPGQFSGGPAWSADSRTLYLPHWPIKRLEKQANGRWKLHEARSMR